MILSRHRTGFTLIEVLVAMAIFGVFSALAYQALDATMLNSGILGDRMDRLESIQTTMRLLARDITQATPRSVRDPLDDHLRPAFYVDPNGAFALEVTHAGWANPAGVRRSTLQRSAWRVTDGVLSRTYWTVLDPGISNEPLVTDVLDDVQSLTFRFRLDNGEWVDQWPPRGAGGPSAVALRPRMVQVILDLEDEGELTRNFEVAR